MKIRLSIILLFVALFGFSQEWKLIKTIKLDQQIASISCDAKGAIYVGTYDGSLIRYDQYGVEDEYYSGLNNAPLSCVQTWNRLKIFTFYREQQTIAILDRFATTPKATNLQDIGLQYARLFAPGIDNSFWAISTEFRELVKYEDQNLNVLFKITLGMDVIITNVTSLRAFKNLLILADREAGIYIFDQFGSTLGHIREPNIDHIEIKSDKIHTTNGVEYLIIDPFSIKVLSRISLPIKDVSLLSSSGENLILASKNHLFIYALN